MQNATAGPSTAIDPALQVESDRTNTDADAAPLRPLHNAHFYSVEYPGYVQPTSVPLAVERLGGQASLEAAFKRTGNKSGSILELNLRPGNHFAHPIPGDVVPTNNIVLKVVKRRRKQRDGAPVSVPGEYTVQAVGVVPKTARFRSMADYQYQPDASDPVVHLREAMGRMDVDSILSYRIPEEKEDYTTVDETSSMEIDVDPHLDPQLAESSQKVSGSRLKSNLRLPPPPLFSRQVVPHLYNYKANPASIEVSVVDEETGEVKQRLLNRMRWKGIGSTAIDFADKNVPEKSSDIVEQHRSQADPKLLKRLEKLFEERPIWSRAALFNQLEAHEIREIVNSKFLLPLVSYVFNDGPWRDTQVRLKYDPRTDPDARFYQRLYFRNTSHQMQRPSVAGRRQEGRDGTRNREGSDNKRSHIFDGQSTHGETAAFQFCDLHDELLRELVENEDDLREVCDERTGWFSTQAFEKIKTVLRYKWNSLQMGYIPTREECERQLAAPEHKPFYGSRPTKHNMAKGAQRPEDEMARRLRARAKEQAKGGATG
ncbi:RNA polymerase III transcription factor IIIC subunit-domain-containing protein [Phanerochaete sordida]|uniref:RNA polymerase III transcription factor IIIC subunit-domain-containing protein n=1 Tax=Phanerochaete sordida TaxID=48140 RepID=A0A9P3FX49_9APHY|nr:RNA polymerase III transcription factor IIIC subunit-domain-containing protein [Phanerochaete sordida]